jgi:hypothetical protein
MSRLRWQNNQTELRRDAYEKRRASQQRAYKEETRFNQDRYRSNGRSFDEKQYRETLNLPIDGKLEPSQIKIAFRKLAQKAHPDAGGSHEQFVRITEARNVLLECFA